MAKLRVFKNSNIHHCLFLFYHSSKKFSLIFLFPELISEIILDQPKNRNIFISVKTLSRHYSLKKSVNCVFFDFPLMNFMKVVSNKWKRVTISSKSKKAFSVVTKNHVQVPGTDVRIGIDSISLSTSQYSLSLESLAISRGIPPTKFTQGIGQTMMSVLSPSEDIVTLGAAAAEPLINPEKPPSMVLFATESGIDASKASGIWVHRLLGLPSSCRVIELKEACYSATAGIQLAVPYVQANPEEEVLIIASDNARYGLKSGGEPTQGCGSCAFTIKSNPRILAFEKGSGVYCEDVMDFWRPTTLSYALVDGKLSTDIYLKSLAVCFEEYVAKTKREFASHSRICYHLPFSKMAEKAHKVLTQNYGDSPSSSSFQDSLIYSKLIGNTYTASLYMGLLSLLENDVSDLSNQRIGLFSYGSGCMAEFFSGIVQPNYKKHLHKEEHAKKISSRQNLTVEEYEKFFDEVGNHTKGSYQPIESRHGKFFLKEIKNFIREYTKQ